MSFQVQVPKGYGPGATLQVAQPDGQTVSVTVPPNCVGGSVFTVNSAPPPLAQPVVAQPVMAVAAQPVQLVMHQPPQAVYVQQQQQQPPPHAGHTHIERYGGDQCGCDNDLETCACAWCFPVCASGTVAAFAMTPRGMQPNDSTCVVWAMMSYCCFPCVHGSVRQQLERRLTMKGQPETPIDFCRACCIDSYCLPCCSLAQELRAIKSAQERGGAPEAVTAVR